MVSSIIRKYCVLSGILFLLPVYSLWAQSVFSLHDLIKAGNKHLPSLQQKQAFVQAAQASITDVQHSFLPQLRASEQLNIASDNSLPGSFFGLGITPSTSAGVRDHNNWQAATGNMAVLYGEYELANFGLKHSVISKARSFLKMQEADLGQAQYLLQQEIATLYFTILRDQHRLEADQQNVERYQSIFIIIQALTASGINPGTDSSLAKAELSRTKISYNQTQGKINALKQDLSFLTGLPAATLGLDTLTDVSLKNKTLFDSFPGERAGHPLLDYYHRKNELIRTDQQLIRKSYLPKLLLLTGIWARGSSIQFQDQYKSLEHGLGFQRFNYGAGIALTYNLFNGIYKKDKLAINRYQMKAAEFELEQQKFRLHSAALQAENNIRTIQLNLQELPVQLQAAEVAYQQKLAQYKAGISTLIDLTNASFVLYRSQTDYIEALNDWYLAQLDKAAAEGNLVQFIQTLN